MRAGPVHQRLAWGWQKLSYFFIKAVGQLLPVGFKNGRRARQFRFREFLQQLLKLLDVHNGSKEANGLKSASPIRVTGLISA